MTTALGLLEPVARLAVATLFNSLWEAALIALVVWAILRVVPNASATTRYAAWSCALGASLLLPLATSFSSITVTRAAVRTTAAAPAGQGANSGQKHTISAQQRTNAAATGHAAVRKTVSPPHAATQASAPVTSRPAIRLPDRFRFALPEWLAIGLFAAWGLATLALLVRLGVNLYRLERLKADALPLPIDYRERLSKWAAADKGGRDVRLCICDRIEVPVAVGLFDSMILIPQHLLDTLSQDEIDQIMLHELAHLRRADDWTNGVQRVIQSLFFFNPAVLFIAQQLDLEREVACDDWVVRQTESVRPYATCLTRMAEVTAWPHRAMAAPGVFVTRRGLSVRVERLLRAGRDIRTSISFGPAGAVVASFIVMFFVLQSVAPTFAFTLQEDITIPAQHIHIPPQIVHVPATNINTKAQQIHRGATNVRVSGFNVDVPSQHVHVSGTNVKVPPMNIDIPAQNVHVHIPKMAVVPNVPPVPNESIDSAVRAGMAGAAIGMSAAARALAHAQSSMQYAQTRTQGRAQADLQKFNCVGCDYSDQNFAGHSFRNVKLSGADFSRDNLQNSDFSGSDLVGVDFSGADLRGANFRDAKLSGCDFSNANVDGASFDGAQVTGCNINARALSPAQARQWLRTCKNGCDFSHANLRGQDLSGLEMTGIDLSDADLTGANLSGAKLTGVDLSGARLDGANVTDTEFTGCDFSHVNLSHVDIGKARFVGDRFPNGNGLP
ncbi:MAG TPA: pentapeptide repeat-containing protein [Candidatus Baltobacteraceae bacterium]|nr:pentapeptide repeat-containing protein [Candidatus Baltobacteraceae bacterium]